MTSACTGETQFM